MRFLWRHLGELGMGLCRLGDYIRACNERNTDNAITLFQGVTVEHEFAKPRRIAEDTASGKIVRTGQFAYNKVMKANNTKLPIALREGPDCVVSSSYQVFEIIDKEKLLPEYLLMWFNRPETQRYAGFISYGTTRDIFSFEDMCNMSIYIPPIEIQRKYAGVYTAMKNHHRALSRGIEDLRLVCDMYIEDLRRKMPCVRLGDYITRHNVRNGVNGTKNVKCVSTAKEFREVGAKVDRENLADYKVCRPRQFAFVHTTNHEKVFAYAFNNTGEDIVVSSVDDVFSVDESIILPEYLCVWFNRSEFDRYARFHSWGSVREVFTWNDLCEVKIPIPDITIQRSIANIYTAAQKRKSLADRLNTLIKSACPVLIKGAIDESQLMI